MSFRRIFWKVTRYARAARFWIILLLAVAAWFGTGDARAQGVSCPQFGTCTRPEAYAGCKAHETAYEAVYPTRNMQCNLFNEGTTSQRYGAQWYNGSSWAAATLAGYSTSYYFNSCPAGSPWNETTKTCGDPTCPTGQVWLQSAGQCVDDCSSGSEGPADDWLTADKVPSGTMSCGAITLDQNACEVIYFYQGNGTYTKAKTGRRCESNWTCPPGTYKHPVYQVCHPIDQEDCPEGAVPVEGICKKPDQCPPGMVENATGGCKPESNTCPAGETKAPDGSCVKNDCPAGQVAGDDGSCKKDANGDGEPDAPGEENEFSGGDDCNSPPMCSGDAIMCGQARIQWRIECNTRRNTQIQGGACDAVPICTGEKCDPVEYAQLIQQWRTSCAVQKLASAVTSGSSGGSVINVGGGSGGGPEGGWSVEGMNQDPGEGVQQGDTPGLGEFSIDGSEAQGTAIVGGGGSCPALGATGLGALSAAVAAVANNPGPAWCQWIAGIYSILLLFFGSTALTILARGW